MNVALVAAIALPAAAGGALLALGARADRIAARGGVGVAAAVLALVLVAVAHGGGAAQAFLPGGALAVGVDGLSAVLLVLVAAVTALVLVAAAAEGQRPAARFTGLMLLFLAAVVVTASATTLPALLVGWEVMGAVSACLIGLRLADPDAVGGGLSAFVVTRSADLGLYLAAGAAVAGGGSLALADLARAAGPWPSVLAAGVIVAALGKAAQLPFSFWLSRAMAGPATASALLHSAAMVAMGGYLLLRMRPLLDAVPWAGPVTAWTGAATAVLLGVVALAQRDLKQLLAASTAAQLGLVVLAAGAGSVAGGVALLVAHAVAKAALFLLAGAWGAPSLDRLGGAGRRDRTAGVLATLAAASLAGLPPLALWAAKDLALAGADPALTATGLLAAVLSAGYAARIVRAVWRPAGEGQGRVPAGVTAPVGALVAAAVGLGALGLPGPSAVVAGLVGASDPPASAPLVAGSALLAAAAFAAGLRWEAPRIPLAAGWFGLERAAHGLVARPVLALAAGAARADDALGRGVAGSGAGLAVLASGVARLDAAGPGGLLRGTAALAAAAGRAARRAQTGALHQYYLAAAVGGVVLAVLAVVVR